MTNEPLTAEDRIRLMYPPEYAEQQIAEYRQKQEERAADYLATFKALEESQRRACEEKGTEFTGVMFPYGIGYRPPA